MKLELAKAVVSVGCADNREDGWFDAVTALVEEYHGRHFRCRTPGATILPAFFRWITSFLIRPFLDKGTRIVIVRNHLDCAGMSWAFKNWKYRWVWKLLRIHNVDELADWCMKRTVRHIRNIARKQGLSLVVVAETVRPGDPHVHTRVEAALEAA